MLPDHSKIALTQAEHGTQVIVVAGERQPVEQHQRVGSEIDETVAGELQSGARLRTQAQGITALDVGAGGQRLALLATDALDIGTRRIVDQHTGLRLGGTQKQNSGQQHANIRHADSLEPVAAARAARGLRRCRLRMARRVR